MKNSVVQYLDIIEKKFHDKIAVETDSAKITFAEYKQRALAVASFIIKNSDAFRKPITVYLPKNELALISFMGILYSGNFYSPIPYGSPVDRAKRICEITESNFIITDHKHSDIVRSFSVPEENIYYIEDAVNESTNESTVREILSHVIDTDPAYVLFTSGSTGMPKGVTVPHRAVIDYMEWVTEEFDIDENNIFANQAPFHFDASMPDIYMPLFTGCTLFIPSDKLFMFPGRLVEEMNNHNVNSIIWVPSALMTLSNKNIFEQKNLNELKLCMFCGEVMPNKQLNIWRKFYPDAVYVNLYGPTEAAYACTYYTIDREFSDSEPLPLGKGCRNTDIMLIDDNSKLITELNVIGEICIRGSSLALGYYSQMENPAFVNDPTHTHYPEKIYRTGDLAWYNDRKELMFAGRKDFQIKHMGYRIELGETETAVMSIEAVRNCACVFDAENDDIILFYEADEGVDKKHIINGISKLIPKYMYPTRFERLDAMPMNMNGKVDRTKLKTMI